MESVLTTPLVNTAASGRLFLELAATMLSAAVRTVTTPFPTSAVVATSSRSVMLAAIIPLHTCAVAITWYPDWVGPLPVAAHAIATAL